MFFSLTPQQSTEEPRDFVLQFAQHEALEAGEKRTNKRAQLPTYKTRQLGYMILTWRTYVEHVLHGGYIAKGCGQYYT